MKVRLVSYTTPALDELPDDSDILDLIAYCARVSNPSNQSNTETSEKLINYLVKWKHWSPFEMANVTLEIETTRDIARQILRHRSFTFQEFSQRYADPVKDLSFEYREARLQDTKNRQNSIETDDRELQKEWVRIQQDVIREAKNAYQWAINNGNRTRSQFDVESPVPEASTSAHRVSSPAGDGSPEAANDIDGNREDDFSHALDDGQRPETWCVSIECNCRGTVTHVQ